MYIITVMNWTVNKYVLQQITFVFRDMPLGALWLFIPPRMNEQCGCVGVGSKQNP
jgi:hypothetical protein